MNFSKGLKRTVDVILLLWVILVFFLFLYTFRQGDMMDIVDGLILILPAIILRFCLFFIINGFFGKK